MYLSVPHGQLSWRRCTQHTTITHVIYHVVILAFACCCNCCVCSCLSVRQLLVRPVTSADMHQHWRLALPQPPVDARQAAPALSSLSLSDERPLIPPPLPPRPAADGYCAHNCSNKPPCRSHRSSRPPRTHKANRCCPSIDRRNSLILFVLICVLR